MKLEDKKQSQKATAEKLKEAEKSCEALKKELEGLDAKEYGTKLEVMLIREKAAAAERISGQHVVGIVCPLVLHCVIMKLQLIGSICTVCVKRSNTTVKTPSRTVLEICLILMESSMMHFYE